MDCIVSVCPLSESEFQIMAEYLSRVGSEMINVTSFLPTPSLKAIFMMSEIQGGSTDTSNVDWTWASEKDLEIGKDNAIEVSLAKMDEWNRREKLKLEEKVRQWEAQRKEQAQKEAEAEEQRIAAEKQWLEDFKRQEVRALEQMEAQLAAQKKADKTEKRKAEGARVVQQGRAASSSKAGKPRQSTRHMSGPYLIGSWILIFGFSGWVETQGLQESL